MTAKQNPGAYAPDGSLYITLTDGSGNLATAGSGTVTSVSVTTANGVSGTVATATTTPAVSLTLGNITPTTVAVGGVGNYSWTSRGVLTSPATGSIQFGDTDAAVAVSQTTRAQSVIAGTAAANGANWTLVGSLPTGTGTSGDIVLQTGVKTGSGTTQGTATTALTIKGETQAVTIASGKSLVLGNVAATGLTAGVLSATTNATIVIKDSTGQAYRIPCII